MDSNDGQSSPPPVNKTAGGTPGEQKAQWRKALVDKAQTGKLSVKELTGATFTVSNRSSSASEGFPPSTFSTL
mgnify:CR=1 FL=1